MTNIVVNKGWFKKGNKINLGRKRPPFSKEWRMKMKESSRRRHWTNRKTYATKQEAEAALKKKKVKKGTMVIRYREDDNRYELWFKKSVEKDIFFIWPIEE